MPTIRIEYEVPDDDCEKCEHFCFMELRKPNLMCNQFKCGLTYNHRVNRCQACIDAEVKEGVYAK